MNINKEKITHLLKKAQAKFSDSHFVVVIPEFLSKKFTGYCSMKEELELALEYIGILKLNNDNIIKSSLTYSLISLYGKCFADATKNNYPKLEPSKLLADYPDFLNTHNYLIELRHQFIAHRGKTENDVNFAFLAIPKYDSQEKSQVRFSQLKMISFSCTELNAIEPLIKYLLEKIKEKIQLTGQEVSKSMFKLFTIEELGLMTFNQSK